VKNEFVSEKRVKIDILFKFYVHKMKRIADWNQTKWLVGSSTFLLVPAMYGYMTKQHVHAGVLVVGVCLSMNHWRDAVYGWCRTIDVVWVRGGAAVFYVYAWKVCDGFQTVMFHTSLLNMAVLYAEGCVQYAQGDSRWVWYHMMFHVNTACAHYVLLESAVMRSISCMR
jgi:hypothetical protein